MVESISGASEIAAPIVTWAANAIKGLGGLIAHRSEPGWAYRSQVSGWVGVSFTGQGLGARFAHRSGVGWAYRSHVRDYVGVSLTGSNGFAVCHEEHCRRQTRISLVANFLHLRCFSPAIRVGWIQVNGLRNAACSGADESRAEFTLAFL